MLSLGIMVRPGLDGWEYFSQKQVTIDARDDSLLDSLGVRRSSSELGGPKGRVDSGVQPSSA